MNLSCNEPKYRRLTAFLWSLGINTLVLVIAFAFSHMEFGTNDDRDISNLLANVNDSPNAHYITFVNVILTKGLSLLYSLAGNFLNWYVLLSVAASFLAMTALGYVLILRSGKQWYGCCLTALLVGILYENHYIIFQFTQNAALLTMAGSILLADGVISGKRNCGTLQLCAGVALAVFGSLIRFQSIVFTFPFLVMYVGYETVFLKKSRGFGSWFRGRIPGFVAIAVCFALVFAARGIHSYVYSSDPELKAFNEENLLRAELLDYGFPSYEENAQELQSLGITQADMELFSKQCFLDKEVFNRDVLEAMVRMKSEQSASYSVGNLKLSSLPAIAESIKNDLANNLVWQVILLCCILFLGGTVRKRWLVALGTLAAPLAMMWYFISVNRMPYRIWYSIVGPAVISMVYLCAIGSGELTRRLSRQGFLADKALKLLQRLCACVLVVGVVLVGINLWHRAAEDDSTRITDTYERVLKLAEEYPNTLILLDRPTISSLTYRSTVDPMTVPDRGSHRNICYQGGWLCWTPGNLSALDHFGISNVYKEIGNGMRVFLVDGRTPELKLEFIRRHYNPNVCMEQIGSVKGSKIGIYRFYIPESTPTDAP